MKILIHIVLFFTVLNLYSQHSITGSIKEANTNNNIPFVNIYIPQLEKGTISDENGTFTLNNIPPGNYKVIFSIIGYETLSKNIEVPQIEDLQIVLNPSAIEMEEIIVSTPFHKLQSENVMKVEKENINDLKANGAVTLADGITDIAGVESISTGLSISKPVIRGLSSNRVLVYTQGVRLENQQFGDEHGLGINDAGIESVEVIKGPASLLYGSDALGGVLYLNPERFAEANTNSGDVTFNYFTNTNGYTTNAGYKSSGDTFKFIFRGSLAEHSDYKTKDYRVSNTRFGEKDFKTALGFQSTTFKTELRYNANIIKPGIPEDIGIQSTNKTPLPPYQEVTNHVLSSKSTIFFKNSSLNVNFGLLYNDRKEFEDEHEDDHEDHDEEVGQEDEKHEDEHHDDLQPALQMKLKTFNYDIKYNLPMFGKFETIVGLQGMLQENSNYGEEQLIPDATTNDIGFLVVTHIHLNTSELEFGARYDHRSIDVLNNINPNYKSFNGAAGIKTNLKENITLRLNLATGFRAPNLAELTSDGVHHGSNRYEVGNVDLTYEQNFQTDLALEFKNEHVEVFANAFYNMVNNYIYLSPNGSFIDNTPVYNYLQNDAKLYGGEFGLHFHPHPLDWLHFESSFETVTGKQNNDDYLPLIPANTFSNTIRIEFNNQWLNKGYAFTKLRTTLKQDKVSMFETQTNGYTLLSAGFGGTVKLFKKDLQLTISGNNLTNKRYINHLSRLKPEGIYNIGRNLSFGIQYNL
ncbi:TonB-dependent receptor [Yeosuana sp. MJ-SS3]|uniref:TonB-dependent receptor n=1 Tax=Gilvirhabdus luticola TaxID=3079858 RepID=A0ABU3U960_9FLAO|nr:TonB-dependent receptor [Yeosuana sp. MJ-SS3]MDU8886925.1 TonB-dependent receptor [Yeosuana sp. MJ-SS3]